MTYYFTETPPGTVWHKPSGQCLLTAKNDATGSEVTGFLLSVTHIYIYISILYARKKEGYSLPTG